MPRIVLCQCTLLVAASLATAQESRRAHWAFRPLVRPAVPAVSEATRTPVDRFILAKLEAKGLQLSTEADRYTLARRLYFELLGLPPSPAELAAFVSDPRADAYERLVDRLLASPHFGERWGRHWLDAAGYTDVIGGDNDAAIVKLGQRKWLYRDWVIRALNEDRPFDHFLTEQLAGDELLDWRSAKEFTPEIRERLIGTGFLRVSADDTDENELNTLDIRHGVLQRTVEIVTSNLLALTFQCAKCHDHKYEPIAQADYYRLIAVVQPAFNPAKWLQPKDRLLADVPLAEKAETERRNAEIGRQQEGRERVRTILKKLGLEPLVDVLSREIAELGKQRRTLNPIHAVYDSGPPTPTHLLKRGDYLAPAEEVRPGFPRLLCLSNSAGEMIEVRAPGSSGRRLALANWLTAPGTPAEGLLLRVRVNRVWQHLFGKGIVESSDNFGVTGTPPTHPELLDWLAAEFRSNGQRLKPLIRLLVTSAVYRQPSQIVDLSSNRQSAIGNRQLIDPENRSLSRMRLRRLESEAVRDSLLSAGGSLDSRLGGEPVPGEVRPDGAIAVRGDGAELRSRRSVYLLARRHYHPTLLNVFDQPAVSTNCIARAPSAVVLQPLTMLNDAFVREQAERFARRVRNEAGSDPTRQVEAAFLIAVSRPPRPAEAERCVDFVRRHDLTLLCHTLLNTSEFLYIP